MKDPFILYFIRHILCQVCVGPILFVVASQYQGQLPFLEEENHGSLGNPRKLNRRVKVYSSTL